MKIIPVIDLLNGQVVHAKQGQRQQYQVIKSSLTKSQQAMDIITALLDYSPFEQVYIADLNAIQKLNHSPTLHYNLIAEITQRFPNVKICLDAGINQPIDLQEWQLMYQQLKLQFILGSESFTSMQHYRTMSSLLINPILSLDFMPQGFQGSIDLMHPSDDWPTEIILMSLSNVGTNQGVNLELIKQYQTYSEQYNLYAAGGIRNLSDLILLKKSGIRGALMATALHNKQLTSVDIENLQK